MRTPLLLFFFFQVSYSNPNFQQLPEGLIKGGQDGQINIDPIILRRYLNDNRNPVLLSSRINNPEEENHQTTKIQGLQNYQQPTKYQHFTQFPKKYQLQEENAGAQLNPRHDGSPQHIQKRMAEDPNQIQSPHTQQIPIQQLLLLQNLPQPNLSQQQLLSQQQPSQSPEQLTQLPQQLQQLIQLLHLKCPQLELEQLTLPRLKKLLFQLSQLQPQINLQQLSSKQVLVLLKELELLPAQLPQNLLPLLLSSLQDPQPRLQHIIKILPPEKLLHLLPQILNNLPLTQQQQFFHQLQNLLQQLLSNLTPLQQQLILLKLQNLQQLPPTHNCNLQPHPQLLPALPTQQLQQHVNTGSPDSLAGLDQNQQLLPRYYRQIQVPVMQDQRVGTGTKDLGQISASQYAPPGPIGQPAVLPQHQFHSGGPITIVPASH